MKKRAPRFYFSASSSPRPAAELRPCGAVPAQPTPPAGGRAPAPLPPLRRCLSLVCRAPGTPKSPAPGGGSAPAPASAAGRGKSRGRPRAGLVPERGGEKYLTEPGVRWLASIHLPPLRMRVSGQTKRRGGPERLSPYKGAGNRKDANSSEEPKSLRISLSVLSSFQNRRRKGERERGGAELLSLPVCRRLLDEGRAAVPRHGTRRAHRAWVLTPPISSGSRTARPASPRPWADAVGARALALWQRPAMLSIAIVFPCQPQRREDYRELA